MQRISDLFKLAKRTKYLLLFLIVLGLLIALAIQVNDDKKEKKLKIFFRYDDFSNNSNLKAESELFKAIQSKKAGIIVGVIPYKDLKHPADKESFKGIQILSKDKSALLKKFHGLGIVDVAIHGFNHRDNNLLNYNSEFAGLPGKKQAQLLSIVKKEIEKELGFSVTAFVPPFNSFDTNTVSALEKEGYTLLSAGINAEIMSINSLKYLPGGPYPFKLRSVVKSAINKKQYDALIVCSMHPYDLKGFGEKLPDFRIDNKQISIKIFLNDLEFIHSLRNVQLISVSDMLEMDEDLSSSRFNANKKLWNSFITKHMLLPNIFGLGLYPLSGLYYSFDAAAAMFRKQIVICALLYLFILVFSYYVISNLNLYFLNSSFFYWSVSVICVLGLMAVAGKIYAGEFYFLAALATLISTGGLSAVAHHCHRR